MLDQSGGRYMLYTLSGAPREAFANFPMPRNTALFGADLRGHGIVRSRRCHQRPPLRQKRPIYGMPKGHLPVRSYLAVPVVSRSGEVLGGLFFGHHETGVFTERDERFVRGIATQAAIAIDNARLYRAAQTEIAERKRTEAALRESEARFRNMADHVPVMVWVTDPTGACTYLSRSWYEFSGQTEQQALGFGWLDIVHPEDRDEPALRSRPPMPVRSRSDWSTGCVARTASMPGRSTSVRRGWTRVASSTATSVRSSTSPSASGSRTSASTWSGR